MVGRVRHILDERRSSSRIGKGWAFVSGVSITLAASAIALAQTRPASSAMQEREAQAINTQTPSDSTSKKLDPMKHTIRGRVLGPDGKPASDATVIWVGRRKPSVPYEDLTDAMLQLPPETVIHGRLLTPAGQPAKGVQVALDGFSTISSIRVCIISACNIVTTYVHA